MTCFGEVSARSGRGFLREGDSPPLRINCKKVKCSENRPKHILVKFQPGMGGGFSGEGGIHLRQRTAPPRINCKKVKCS